MDGLMAEGWTSREAGKLDGSYLGILVGLVMCGLGGGETSSSVAVADLVGFNCPGGAQTLASTFA